MSRSTDYDSALNDCDICGCPNTVKVHYSDEIIAKETEQHYTEFPNSLQIGKERRKCWVREILERQPKEKVA